MHINAFDSTFDQPQAQPTAPQYAVVPEGRAEVEIMAASIGDLAWKVSDANPTGACLKLRLSAGRRFAFVFADLPRDRAPLFKALAAALGIAPGPDGKVTMPEPHDLVGRTALVEIGHYQTRRGETRACVRKWLPPETPSAAASTPPAATARPRRTAAQRITARLPDDDIPF